MTTYMFAERDGNSALILDAENEEEAVVEMKEKVKYNTNWRFEGEA